VVAFRKENQGLGIRIELYYGIGLVLPIGSISSGSSGNFGLPLVTVSQQLLLVVQQFFAGLGGVFSVGG